MSRLRFWIAVLMFLSAGINLAEESAEAKAILQTAGVNVGLCLHLGCGRTESAALTAALAENSSLLVHGLAIDEAALALARKAIEARQLAGRAMVEHLTLKPLPYLSDLAGLIVIEDLAALTGQGLTREEIQRVLAPGGVLCQREGGKWTKSVKPRPKEMDEWTHPHHGADGNLVSTDALVKFPLGLRWIDGLPMNINRWASCRSWIVAGGRVFMVSSNQIENIGNAKPYYLAAHDAWSGIPLWKINLQTSDDGAFLTWVNTLPVASDGMRVFAGTKDKCIGVDAATGRIELTLPTKYPPAKLLLSDGVVVVSCWEAKTPSKAKFDRLNLWATWAPQADIGSVEAYDAKTGNLKWSLTEPSQALLAADGVVYLLLQKGNPMTERTVVAVDLATGKERWRVPHTRFGDEPDLQLNVAAKGYVVVAKIGDITGLGAPKKEPTEKPKQKAFFVLSAADGKTLWQVTPAKSIWTPIVAGLLWYQSNKYDPLTGQIKGNIGWGVGDQACTPQAIVGNMITRTRGGQYIQLPGVDGSKAQDLRYNGARGACMEGMVGANGMFYTAQNNCACTPGQVYGFVAIGPCGEIPSADFEKTRPLVKGPAFGAAPEELKGAADWPAFRHDAERTAASASKLPDNLKELWRQQVAAPAEGPLAEAWKARLGSCLSAPVSAGDRVFAAATDAGQVVALDASTGKKLWSVTLASRLDTPPTLYQGLCLIGCHDGWLYALRAKDGQLSWRTRVAPVERRMVAYGQTESVWPAVGTVVVHNELAYANAGRTSESDGGIAVLAFKPLTGEHVWGKAIGAGPQRMNDMLAIKDGDLAWYNVRLDAKTGQSKPTATVPKEPSMSGMLDGSWTVAPFRRSGKGFHVGNTSANLLAWNQTLLVSPSAAISRANDSNLWAVPRGGQIEAVALCGNAALFAGRLNQAGKVSGFLRVLSLADGKQLLELALDAPPTYDGLAVANERVYVSLQNGTLLCFGR